MCNPPSVSSFHSYITISFLASLSFLPSFFLCLSLSLSSVSLSLSLSSCSSTAILKGQLKCCQWLQSIVCVVRNGLVLLNKILESFTATPWLIIIIYDSQYLIYDHILCKILSGELKCLKLQEGRVTASYWGQLLLVYVQDPEGYISH